MQKDNFNLNIFMRNNLCCFKLEYPILHWIILSVALYRLQKLLLAKYKIHKSGLAFLKLIYDDDVIEVNNIYQKIKLSKITQRYLIFCSTTHFLQNFCVVSPATIDLSPPPWLCLDTFPHQWWFTRAFITGPGKRRRG